jgi:PhnB protein
MAKKKQAKSATKSKSKSVAKMKAMKRPAAKAKAKVKSPAKPTSRAAKKPAKAAAPARSKALASGYQWINTFLTVRDVQSAIDFYSNALGFRVRFTMPGPDGKIVHAELQHEDSVLMLGPENPERGALAPTGPTAHTIYMYVENVDAVTDRAANLGAKIVDSVKDQFWGDRTSMLIDPQGHSWMLATHVRDVSPDEMQMPPQ